jgi:epoxyqueuosine reductase
MLTGHALRRRQVSDDSKSAHESEVGRGTSRRDFLKTSVAGAAGLKWGAAAVAGTGVVGVGAYAHRKSLGTVQDEFPVPVRDDLVPMDQRDMLFTFATSKELHEAHPERVAKFEGFNFYEHLSGSYMQGPPGDEPGYTQLDRALAVAGWEPNEYLAPGEQYGQPGSGILTWDQSDVSPTRYEFESPEDASLAIKSAARVFNARRCGITTRDRRWEYDPLYDIANARTLTWEDDFPFEPKTVIVMLVEMDYANTAASPAWTAIGTVGDGYSMADKCAGQMAKFLRGLGYRAVGAQNDLAMSVPYAVAAGLGEGARNGALIAPRLGPRHRICKVFTDLELVEIDKPRTFGIASFCKECKRCAHSCPSEAITLDKEPSWGPQYEGGDDPEYSYQGRAGILKYHNDAKKCLRFWIENDGGCSNCITSCPYNKPEFWHHAFVDSTNVIAPGPAHAFMREMDTVFGYGTVSDPEDVRQFWRSGEDMRGG